MPKLVFVGDGPARLELETICRERGFDATFMGHRGGEELAMCYASADIFAFPSFTEVGFRTMVGSAALTNRLSGKSSWKRLHLGS